MPMFMFEGNVTYQATFYVEAEDKMMAKIKANKQKFVDVDIGEEIDVDLSISSCEQVNE